MSATSVALEVARELDVAAHRYIMMVAALTGLHPGDRCELNRVGLIMLEMRDRLDPARIEALTPAGVRQ